VFDARAAADATLERRAEAAMEAHLGRSFYTIVRRVDALQTLLAGDPYETFRLPANAKRVVTFLREPHGAKLALPLELDGARILAVDGREVFTAYVPSANGPAFMTLIEKTFGKHVTTRTWDTVRKCAAV
jgi:uncharacterized protein (DUF1697 family)